MEYWTVMLITVLSGHLDGAQVAIPFETAEQCNAATQEIGAVLPYDFSMECRVSDTPSGSIRPMQRPEVVE
jgi:hypothetical protein